MFWVLEREQRMSVDEDGNDAGMANRQHCNYALPFDVLSLIDAGALPALRLTLELHSADAQIQIATLSI